MNITRKLMLIIIISVTLVSIPSACLVFIYTKQHILTSEADALVDETRGIMELRRQNLDQANSSLTSLAAILSKGLAEHAHGTELAEFDELVERDSDHAWRSRVKDFNGHKEAGIFLPPDAKMTPSQKILHLRSKRIMDIFGGSVTLPFSNVWLLTLDKSEIIYDKYLPDFALLIQKDNDYTKTPWVTLGNPTNNPLRELRWTPPLFDPVPQTWMVSAIMPIDFKGQWIGTIGHDIYLNNLFPSLLQHSKRYPGELHFLLDAKGNYLEAGPWQKQLVSNPNNFRPDLLHESDLHALFGLQLNAQPEAIKNEVSFSGKKYLAIGMLVTPVGWHYFRLVPTDEILAPMRHLFFMLVAMVILIGFFIGLLIESAVKRNIISRLQELAETLRRYGTGQLNIRANKKGNDEIAKASQEFDAMADNLKATLDAIPDLLFDIDLNGQYHASHSPQADLLAAPPQELIGKTVHEVLPIEAAEVVMSAIDEAHKSGRSEGKQFCLHLAKGKMWFELSVARKSLIDEECPRFIVLSRNITTRKLAEVDLQIAAISFEAQEGMLITDANNIILRVNNAFTSITGYSADEVIGKSPSLLNSGRHDLSFYSAMWRIIELTDSWQGEIWNRRKNGEIYPQYLTITAVRNQENEITNYVATLTDITSNKAAEEEIKNLAFFDHLTGLPNRRLLLDRLVQALASSSRSNKQGAILFIDLDNFKSLNDTLGHDVGDMLLTQVAERLSVSVREGDTVARLGGDEFVVMFEDLSENLLEAASIAESIGNKILTNLNLPFLLCGNEYHSTSSIGATLFNDHKQSVDDLLKQADIAMYQAKKAGRNTLRFFDPDMQASITARVAIEQELRTALENNEFELYYQIQVDNTNRPIGAEALIRWKHPKLGLVPPAKFIQLAEETGLIVAIGHWVIETACAQLKKWQQNELLKHLSISVNVSAKQFRQPGFAAQVKAHTSKNSSNPKLLKLELTESILLEDINITIETMKELRRIGVRFALDDFGTGYSSLKYIKRLPLDQLKIDQSFVADLVTDKNDKAIVSTIIAIAKSLNLDVIAEGVESEDQQKMLLEKGCSNFQGYLFGKPLPLYEFEVMLKKLVATH